MAARVNILAFDTSSACSIALQQGHQVKAMHEIAPMQQARLILPMIQELLDSSSLMLSQLDAIAYGCGPGSFTGIRIASSVAQGLSFAAQLPIIKISSLAALAQAVFLEQKWPRLLVAVDARMGEVYWASYEVNPSGSVKLLDQEIVCAPDLITVPEGENWYAVGDGWDSYSEIMIKRLGFKPQAVHSKSLPTAEAVLKLASIKFTQGDLLKTSEAIPTYLR